MGVLDDYAYNLRTKQATPVAVKAPAAKAVAPKAPAAKAVAPKAPAAKAAVPKAVVVTKNTSGSPDDRDAAKSGPVLGNQGTPSRARSVSSTATVGGKSSVSSASKSDPAELPIYSFGALQGLLNDPVYSSAPSSGIVAFDPIRQDTAAMNAALAQPPALNSWLDSIHTVLQAPYNARVAANDGAVPFEGPIDWNGMYAALQKPYNDRITREAAARNIVAAPNNGTLLATSTTPLAGLSAAVNFSNDRLPRSAWGTSEETQGIDPLLAFANSSSGANQGPGPAVSPAIAGIDAALVPLPRPRPTPPSSALQWEPVATSPATSGDTWAGLRGPAENIGGTAATPGLVTGGSSTASPSKWDSVVDNTGKLLSHTGLGAIVSTLFPDQWNGMGDAFKGMGDGSGSGAQTKYPDDMSYALSRLYGDPHNGHGHGNGGANGAPAPAVPTTDPGFPDVNHNGIDDRLEGIGGASPPDLGGNQFRSNRQAVFPDMPPYRPGVDDEWNYFHDHLARGGVVGYADRDPRVSMIADAEDALHRGDHGHPSLDKFVDTFGPKALENLNNNVRAGYRMRAGRVVSGPGGPTDDAVPAVIDGQHPAKLSSGEYVVPVNAVEGIGGGDAKLGAERLHQLVERFAK